MHFSKNGAIVALAVAAGTAAQTNGTDPVTGLLGNATRIYTNPVGVSYEAVLPAGKKIQGSVVAYIEKPGAPLKYKVNFSGFPTEGGPFLYHVHEKPVPSDGNCTGTGAHQDPYKRGEVPPCNASLPETCQTGDLSGKHGKITADPWVAVYEDPYTSTDPSTNAFIGNLSIVVHFANKTRITCANFTRVATSNGTNTTYTMPTLTSTSTSTAVSTIGPITTTTTGSATTSSGPAVATTNAAAILGSQMAGWTGLLGIAAAFFAL